MAVNFDYKVEDKWLVIRVDLTQDFGPSSSKKTVIVGSSEGAVSIPYKQGYAMTCTVYKKPAV